MKEGKKIITALVSTGLGHVKRGIETWTADLGRELNARDISCRVYKGGGKQKEPYECVISCLRRDTGFNKWIIHNRPGFLWRYGLSTTYTLEEMTFSWNILPELLLRQYDIIHTQDPDVALFCQRLHKYGLVKSRMILAHGTEEKFDFLKQFDYIQHLAPFHQEESKKYAVRSRQSFVIGNFVDTDIYKPAGKSFRKELNIPEDAFVVLSVAAIKKVHKRIDYLIDEVSGLKSSNICLVIAGSETTETAPLMEYGRARLGKRIVFLKNYPHDEIHKVYASADIFVLCSLKEMMPIALLEAISSGLPGIVHKYPVEEWIIGEGGESIDMSKKGELAVTIGKYLSNEYRNAKSQKARLQAVRNFSKDVIVEKILRMYEEVLND